MVQVNQLFMILVSLLTGLLMGLLMVALDPWLRFGDVPVRVNWEEALLTAAITGAYGATLGWLATSFWRRRILWVAAILVSPIVTGVMALWNASSGVFGFPTNFIILYPFVASIHLLLLVFVVAYMNMSLRYRWRHALVYTAVPLALLVFAFPSVGRVRWLNPEARRIMVATDNYASESVEAGYQLEYLGTRYRDGAAPTGTVRIHTDSASLLCRVRLFPLNPNVSCEEEE